MIAGQRVEQHPGTEGEEDSITGPGFLIQERISGNKSKKDVTACNGTSKWSPYKSTERLQGLWYLLAVPENSGKGIVVWHEQRIVTVYGKYDSEESE
jgi:hypothetical protein